MPATAAPTWDPAQYLRHAGHRARPFTDLLARIPDLPADPPRIADLGCGPGNATALLADRWPTARITGYDNSPQMLERARQYAAPPPAAATSTSPPPTPAPGPPTSPATSSSATPPSSGSPATPTASPTGSTASPPAAPSPSRCPATSTPPATA